MVKETDAGGEFFGLINRQLLNWKAPELSRARVVIADACQ
jgi:hypothetical protein